MAAVAVVGAAVAARLLPPLASLVAREWTRAVVVEMALADWWLACRTDDRWQAYLAGLDLAWLGLLRAPPAWEPPGREEGIEPRGCLATPH